jgi:hypothetical protein
VESRSTREDLVPGSQVVVADRLLLLTKDMDTPKACAL